MRFTKMHGIGNDYVYVDCRERDLPDPPHVARAVSRRRGPVIAAPRAIRTVTVARSPSASTSGRPGRPGAFAPY